MAEPTEPAVPEALQRAVDDAIEAWHAGYDNCPHTASTRRLECAVCLHWFIIRHVLAAKVCTEPEHEIIACVCGRLMLAPHVRCCDCLAERAESAEEALAAAQAERDEALKCQDCTEYRHKIYRERDAALAERDTYKARLEQAQAALTEMEGRKSWEAYPGYRDEMRKLIDERDRLRAENERLSA